MTSSQKSFATYVFSQKHEINYWVSFTSSKRALGVGFDSWGLFLCHAQILSQGMGHRMGHVCREAKNWVINESMVE